jgi:hypothetical protein
MPAAFDPFSILAAGGGQSSMSAVGGPHSGLVLGRGGQDGKAISVTSALRDLQQGSGAAVQDAAQRLHDDIAVTAAAGVYVGGDDGSGALWVGTADAYRTQQQASDVQHEDITLGCVPAVVGHMVQCAFLLAIITSCAVIYRCVCDWQCGVRQAAFLDARQPADTAVDQVVFCTRLTHVLPRLRLPRVGCACLCAVLTV